MRWLSWALAAVLLLAARPGLCAGSYDAAEYELTRQIESGKLSGDALGLTYLRRGYVRMLTRDAEGAIADLNSAIDAAPKMLEAYELRAEFWRLTGRADQAIADASQAIALAPPDDPAPFMIRASIWEQSRDYAKAVADYDAALGRDPKKWEARVLRGIAFAELGDDEHALADLDEAIKTDPGTLGTRKHTECIRTQAQTTPNCKSEERPIYSKELLDRAYRSRGVLLLHQGAYERAAADLDIAGYTDGAMVYLGLANLALGKCRKGYSNIRMSSNHDSVPLEQALATHREFIMKTECAEYVFE